jgi:hypothetical protein
MRCSNAGNATSSMKPAKIIMPMVLAPDLDPGMAAVACAHGSLAGFLTWRDDPIVQEWLAATFYKRIYQAPDPITWRSVMAWPGALVLTESRLDHSPVLTVFKPMRWSSSTLFSNLPLYPRP